MSDDKLNDFDEVELEVARNSNVSEEFVNQFIEMSSDEQREVLKGFTVAASSFLLKLLKGGGKK